MVKNQWNIHVFLFKNCSKSMRDLNLSWNLLLFNVALIYKTGTTLKWLLSFFCSSESTHFERLFFETLNLLAAAVKKMQGISEKFELCFYSKEFIETRLKDYFEFITDRNFNIKKPWKKQNQKNARLLEL